LQKEGLIKELDSVYTFFMNTIDCLSEEDSKFTPKEGMFTTSQQIAHAAKTIDWFMDGAFVSNGFDMNFDKLEEETKKVTSLEEAKTSFGKAINRAKDIIGKLSDEELVKPLPEGPIMGGVPKLVVIGALADHTAHHRGALAVYARLIGKEPKMPYS
jgi:uncharacterized damage-inducible protein DinB